MNTGKIIRDIRTTRNMTQPQLADKSGISLTSIKKYERGIVTPKLDQLIKIADALDTSINRFINLEINTTADLFSVLLQMTAQVDMKILADKDSTGKILPERIRFFFANKAFNQKLSAYLSALNQQNELSSFRATLPEKEYQDRLALSAHALSEQQDLLLNDITPVLRNDSSVLINTVEAIPSVDKTTDVSASSDANTRLTELLSDCTAEESEFIIRMAALTKEYLHQHK